MVEWSGYLLFECGLGLFCWRLLGRYGWTEVERLAAWLSLRLVLPGLPPGPTRGSLWAGLVLLLLAWKLFPPTQVPFFPKGWKVLLPLTGMLAVFLRPVREPDSLFNLHFVIGWVWEGRSIYDFAFHYVPFWETIYVPALASARTDALLWPVSLQAIALLGALLWMLAEEFGLAGRLRWLVWGNAMLFVHLWHGPSGLATIKNDMIAAAGQAALALALLRMARGQFGVFERALTIAGAVFVCTKFSGPVLLVLVLPLLLWPLRRDWKWLLMGVAVWTATVGHVYIRNAWVHGNPVYPFQLNLGPVRLPGLGDLSNTSILYNLDHPEIWRRFFLPEGGVSPLGLLFPLAFALLPLALWRAHRAYAYFTLACLLVYLRSVFSASGQPGDLQFVKNDLNSFRYFEGAYLTAELFLLSLLMKWPRAAFAASGVSAASRIWILYVRAAPEAAPDWGLFAGGVSLMLGAVALWAWRPRWAALSLLLWLPAGALVVESRRAAWLPQWQALYGPLYEPSPGDLFLVVDDKYSEQACAHLPLLGKGLTRAVRSGPWPALRSERYVVWLRRDGKADPTPAGYLVKARTPAGILWERAGR